MIARRADLGLAPPARRQIDHLCSRRVDAATAYDAEDLLALGVALGAAHHHTPGSGGIAR